MKVTLVASLCRSADPSVLHHWSLEKDGGYMLACDIWGSPGVVVCHVGADCVPCLVWGLVGFH